LVFALSTGIKNTEPEEVLAIGTGAVVAVIAAVASHPHAVADERSELLNAVEEFWLRGQRRVPQIASRNGKILPHDDKRALEALLFTIAARGATASRLVFEYLDYLAHHHLGH